MGGYEIYFVVKGKSNKLANHNLKCQLAILSIFAEYTLRFDFRKQINTTVNHPLIK